MPETGGTPATGKILRGCRAFWLTFDNENWTCLGISIHKALTGLDAESREAYQYFLEKGEQ